MCLVLSSGYFVSEKYVATVTRGVVDKLLTQARSYSGPVGKLIIGTASPDALLLSNTCKKLASDNPDVYWAGVTNPQDVFIAHTDIKKVVTGGKFAKLSSGEYGDLLRSGEGLRFSKDTLFISVPIQENGVEVGSFDVASSTKPISDARRASTMSILVITLVVLLVGMPSALFLLNRKLRPISIISEHLKTVNADDISIDIPITSRNELGYLSETLRVMGSRLNDAQKELIEKQRYAQELEIAHEIQASILPKEFPRLDHLDVSGTYRSAREVGGDYYDFFNYDDNRFGFLVADVSGKSLPGMLVMLMTRDIVRNYARSGRSPAEILSQVNKELHKSIRKGMFVTMFLGIFCKEENKLVFASAGHNPLLHFNSTSNRCRLLKTKGFPLGMMPGGVFEQRIEEAEIGLGPGDILIQYTDGVNEAINSGEEEFGLDRLVEFTTSHADIESAKYVKQFMGSHTEFVGDADQYDDITLLVMKWKASTADRKLEKTEAGASLG